MLCGPVMHRGFVAVVPTVLRVFLLVLDFALQLCTYVCAQDQYAKVEVDWSVCLLFGFMDNIFDP